MTSTADLITETLQRLTMDNWCRGTLAAKTRHEDTGTGKDAHVDPRTEDAQYFCIMGMFIRVANEHHIWTPSTLESLDPLYKWAEGRGITPELNDDVSFSPEGLENLKQHYRRIADEMRGQEGDQ